MEAGPLSSTNNDASNNNSIQIDNEPYIKAWIYGANLNQAPQVICWIQALWINASGIAAGITILIYSFEIYRSLVLRVTEGEWLRRKFYLVMLIIIPILVGIIPPAILAEKPNGILPGPYFCVLYKPEIPMIFISIQGWNTLTSLFGIYFSIRTATMVVKFIYIRKGVVKPKPSPIRKSRNIGVEPSTPTASISNFHNTRQIDECPPLSSRTIASIPMFVCIRLVTFGVLYCAVTILVYGRNLVLSIKGTPYDSKKPFMEYIIASLGIVLFIVFGTSMEAIRAYWKFIKIILSCQCLKMRRDESFSDWEIQKEKREEMEKAKNLNTVRNQKIIKK
ncbi:3088_t:CDS:2 [Funneliformis geosporum]|nr:3088_t:CDS:2 [Funneliformis geosporum]